MVGRALACAALLAFGAAWGATRAGAASRTFTVQVGATIGARCAILTTPVSFGYYRSTDVAPLDGTGLISLNCAPSRFVTRIRIGQGLNPGPGSNNPNPARRMTDGAGSFLRYNLYRDAARTQLWGNTIPTGVQPGDGPYPMNVPVYGRVFANQPVQAGDYTDTVEVTILF